MHPANPFAGRCIHCAFRTHQLALSSRRLRRSYHYANAQSQHAERRPLIRRTGGPASNDQTNIRTSMNRDGARRERIPGDFSQRLEPQGKVRKITRFNEGRANPTYDFASVLTSRLQAAKEQLKDVPLLAQLRKEAQASGEKAQDFESIWKRFCATVVPNPHVAFMGTQHVQDVAVVKELQDAFRMRGQSGLDDRIRYAFYAHLTGSRFTHADIRNQQTLADLRYPSEWYPATRAMHRTIHLHVGPTNSGKTYHALQRLEAAETGVYAGPLRLLAHEVYSRMNAKGIPCSLVTGEERRLATQEQGTTSNAHFAYTVEMMPINRTMDVAIIDEIQMIGSPERGWAWTQALMGVKAKEVHLCGEERAVPLIREICASVGEKLEIHRYERLSPLKVADQSLKGKLSNLRKGDCIVSFSVMGIHALRRQIERATGKKVATVYGSLPPETRAQQARLFNDPDNDYDYLVASDAVGMGLNLAIKRIIFEHSSKFDGTRQRQLGVADVKQIAGRAGRYRIAGRDDQDAASTRAPPMPPSLSSPNPTYTSSTTSDGLSDDSTGLVTTLEDFDYPFVRAAMSAAPEPITSAGLFPPASVLERFSSYFPPSTPFSYILTRLHELSQMHTRFHLCGLKDQVWIADLIEPVKGLTVSDRNVISSCPASKSDTELWQTLMPAYAKCIAEQAGGSILDIHELPLERLDAEVDASREYLRSLEQLHKGIVAYLWLSYRFAGIFTTRALATHVKGLVEVKIDEALGKFNFSDKARERVREMRERELMREMERSFAGVDEVGGADAVKMRDVVRGRQGGRDAVEEKFVFGEERLPRPTDGEEVEFPFEDPMQADIVAAEERRDAEQDGVESDGNVSSFAEWRAQETKVDAEGPKDDGVENTISDFVAEGEDVATEAAAGDQLFDVEERDDLPSVASVVPDEVPSAQTASLEDQENAVRSGHDSLEIERAVMSETGLHESRREDVNEASAQPVAAHEDESLPPITNGKVPPFSPGMPPKHLHSHLDVEVKEAGTDVGSRP